MKVPKDVKSLLEEKIESLEKVIEYRDSDEWLDQERKGRNDTNKYFWWHNGEFKDYDGRLKALKGLKEELGL